MKQRRYLLPMVCVVLSVCAVATAIAAETAPGVQDLLEVRASNKFDRAVWLRGSNHYSLQFMPLRSTDAKVPASPTSPAAVPGAPPAPDRASFFVGNTIANLRGVSPEWDPPRILTLIDARRVVAGQVLPAPKIQVWLLRADGTQIQTTWDSRYKLFSAPASEAVQAVAAAIQIDDEYYIEKLESLEPKPPVQ